MDTPKTIPSLLLELRLMALHASKTPVRDRYDSGRRSRDVLVYFPSSEVLLESSAATIPRLPLKLGPARHDLVKLLHRAS